MISKKRIAIKFVLLVISFLFISGDAEVRCIKSEREALLSFKNGLMIENYGILSSWRSNECCEWYGVQCSNTTGYVIALNLHRANLSGKFGSSLVELHHLKYLDLSGNGFGGIPIPKFIGSMKQLQHLFLDGCGFCGIIPPQLGNLTNLRSLDLGWNEFGGIPIPQFIGSMKKLQHLSLQFSMFSGSIPPQLGNLTNLRLLDLSSNSLCYISLSKLGFVFESLEILDLSYNHLNGSMPDPRALPSLTKLYLLNNNFTAIPVSIGQLSKLQILDLSRNSLEGSVPLSIGQLSKLQIFDLSRNSLKGSVPLSIGQLSKLQILDLSHNSLEGLVSESHFSKLYKLKSLDLSFNSLIIDIASNWSPPFQLDGINLARCNVGPYFPKWLQTQRNLTYLNLDGANIIDEAPRWLVSMSPRLEELSLSYNQMSGTIPDLSSISSWYIDLSYNQFSGPIPLFHAHVTGIDLSGNMLSGSISSICKTYHHYLEYLDLSNNQLAGNVPNCWGNISRLESLNLANNSFSGQIPPTLGTLHHLYVLQLHGNNFSGVFPYNLRFCQELVLLDVGGNKLTKIPSWIGHLYRMQFLNFRGNKLHGSIPPEICNLTCIQVMDFSINNLSSIIPDCFNNFTVLVNINRITYIDSVGFSTTYGGNESWEYTYSSFQWKGKEYEYKENLGLLKLIDFSSNRLAGNVPKSFSTMRGLISLNLSRNNLSGYIIPDIGKMGMLDSLDLSHNQLSGEIPTSLAEIHTLGVLDLSNNHLFGKIPTGTQLQTFSASSYAENDGLCGDPLPKCPGDSLRPSTPNPEKDGINFSFMQEVGISMGFGFIFGFWGVIGSFILKKSWRIAFFNFFDATGDWFYVRTSLFVSKWRRS